MNGVPQGLALGMAEFNTFVGNMDIVIKSSFIKFADDNKLCGVVDMLGEMPYRDTLAGLGGGLVKPHKVQQGQVQGSASESGQFQAQISAEWRMN
ncbi:hypothetical protein WISP_122539 [Willisornis vidua]|uniref:Uncharacterized protein n=1 Tax=Willisornis vidua TaxID=1566151 RepID=A0ABQ9CV40_9PASS|nr:hypothetical protein WISP_122539 [Willisornis vidua]